MMCYEIMQFFLHYVKIISLSRKGLPMVVAMILAVFIFLHFMRLKVSYPYFSIVAI